MANEVEMIPVVSSQIESIGFNKETNQTYVRFLSKAGPGKGSLYEDDDRTEEEFEKFLTAPSKYKFFALHIKPTKLYRKVQ